MTSRRTWIVALLVALMGCNTATTGGRYRDDDAGTETRTDSGTETHTDAGTPTAADSGAERRPDSGPGPTPDAGTDADTDAGTEPPPGIPPSLRRYAPPDPARGEAGTDSDAPRTIAGVEVLGPRAVRFYFRGNSDLASRPVHQMKIFVRTGSFVMCRAWLDCADTQDLPHAIFEGFEPNGSYYASLTYDDGTSTDPISFRTPAEAPDAAPPSIESIVPSSRAGYPSLDVYAFDDTAIEALELYLDDATTPLYTIVRDGFHQLPTGTDSRRYAFYVPATVHGAHTVRVHAVDTAGRESTRSVAATFD